MNYDAIIFDLFGTLVPDFAPSRYEATYRLMAAEVALPYDDFRERFGGTFHERIGGRYATIAENVREVCAALGALPADAALHAAAAHRHAFTRSTIAPDESTLSALATLRRMGLRVGLLTNCGPDVPEMWEETPLAPFFDVAAFSCLERRSKPDVELYRSLSQRLGVEPGRCIYVGDGSDRELSGAREAGLLPVLKRTNLADVYDSHRPDVAEWSGHAIDRIAELPTLISMLP